MIARPSAKFARSHMKASWTEMPYERRSVCVLPTNSRDHLALAKKCNGRNHTHFTRSKVVDAVARKEMTWIDENTGLPTNRATNLATFTKAACSTWQKTRSGPVCTMQLIAGARGRYVPATQRESRGLLVESPQGRQANHDLHQRSHSGSEPE
jgi:hypothetical protein